MKERIRIAAIIVKNHKLLLVKGSDKYKEYWTPGGKKEDEESDVDALNRELDEEIHVKVVSAKFFGEYVAKSAYEPDIIMRSRVYITTVSGDIEVGKEIQSYVWMTREEFDN